MILRALLLSLLLGSVGCREKVEAPAVDDAPVAESDAPDVVEPPGVSSSYARHFVDSAVKFRPWSEFATANRPVLLTIGATGCAACEALATTKFNDAALADAIDRDFVPVLLDAAQYPEVAQFYAEVAANGHVTSWPATFFVNERGDAWHVVSGAPTVDEVRAQAAQVRRGEGKGVSEAIASLSGRVRAAHAEQKPTTFVRAELLRNARQAEVDLADQAALTPEFVRFMLRASAGDVDLVNRAVKRINNFVANQWDPVGGGFFDAGSNAKSLSSNAKMLRLLTEGWQRSQNPEFERLARRTAAFILRDLQSSGALFHARLLPTAAEYYAWDDAAVAEATDEELDALRLEREARPNPPRADESLLTAANAEAIDSLAYAGFALSEPDWVEAASQAAFALPAEGIELKRNVLAGVHGPPASGNDIAHAVRALLTVFQYSAEATHFRRAVMLQTQLTSRYSFANGEFSVDSMVEETVLGPLSRPSDAVNTLSLENMLRIDALRDDAFFAPRIRQLVNVLAAPAGQNPLDYGEFLVGAQLADHSGLQRVTVLGSEPEELLAVVRTGYFPGAVVGLPGPVMLLPWMGDKQVRGGATAYVCGQGGCSEPLLTPPALASALRNPAP